MNNTEWSTAEEVFIRNNYPNFKNTVLAELLFDRFNTIRTPKSIARKIEESNKSGKHGYIKKWPTWTSRHDIYLEKNYTTLSDETLAKNMLMPPSRVSRRRIKLGLTRKVPAMSKEEIRLRLNEHNRLKRQEVTTYSRNLKAREGCTVCGETNPTVLHWHHIDPSTKTIEPCNARTIEQLDKELKLCVCVCANHHLQIHAGELSI